LDRIVGKVWLFGDNIDTDQILPGYAMTEDVSDLHKFAMAGSVVPDFSREVEKGDIIVGGKNFGCGSSREQAPVALKNAGVALVIAKSFAGIFRKNAINIGLPVIAADLSGKITQGEMISVSLENGEIEFNSGAVERFHISENALETIKAGGLINRVRHELMKETS